MFGIGPMEMLVVGIVAVILFGNRLPEVARSLGRSLTEFKKGMQEFEQEVKDLDLLRHADSLGLPRSTSVSAASRTKPSRRRRRRARRRSEETGK